MANEVQILTPALESAIAAWEQWKNEKSILTLYPPPPEVLDPLADAIEATDEFKKVAGRPVLTGYSGVVATGGRLAVQFLYRADAECRLGNPGAVDWLLRVFNIKTAKGPYEVAIWGPAPDREISICQKTLRALKLLYSVNGLFGILSLAAGLDEALSASFCQKQIPALSILAG